MSIYNLWNISFQGSGGDWITEDSAFGRNVTGSSLVSVVNNGYAEEVPGVLRFRVVEKNINQYRVTSRLLNAGDSGHPSLSTTGVWVAQGAAADNLMDGVTANLNASMSVGDEFDLACGYYWDSTNELWIPVRAFGIVVPGTFGNTMSMKMANISERARVFTRIGWTNNGPSLWWIKLPNGVWQSSTDSPVYVSGNDGVPGYVAPDDEITVEFRPEIPDTAGSSYNPVILQITIDSTEI